MGFGMGFCCCGSGGTQRVVVSHLRYNYTGSSYANVTCMDGSNGSILWYYDFGLNAIGEQWGVSRPFIGSDGHVYLSASSLSHIGTQPFTGPDFRQFTQKVVKLDADTGALLWSWSQNRSANTNFAGGGSQATSDRFGINVSSLFGTKQASGISQIALSQDETQVFVSLGIWLTSDPSGIILNASDGSSAGTCTVPSTDGSANWTSSPTAYLDPRPVYLRDSGDEFVWASFGVITPPSDTNMWRSLDDGSYVSTSYGTGGQRTTYDPINDVINSRTAGSIGSGATICSAFDLGTPMGALTSLTYGGFIGTNGDITKSTVAADMDTFSNGDVLIAAGRIRNSSSTDLMQIGRGQVYPTPGAVWPKVIGTGLFAYAVCVDRVDDTFFVITNDGKCRKFEDNYPTAISELWATQVCATGAAAGSDFQSWGPHARTI